MATEATGPTPPDPGRPLSAQEQDALDRLAAATRREDPAWSDALAGRTPPARRRPTRIWNLLVQVVVVGVLAVVLMPSAWVGAVLVAVVMIGPTVVALWAMRRGQL